MSAIGADFTISLPGLLPAILGRGQIYSYGSIGGSSNVFESKPDATDEIQSDETSGKALNEMPAAVQLLL